MENDKQFESLLEEAKILIKQGVNGNEDAVKEAYKILKSLQSKAPQNNLIEAYYGSVLSLLGRDATDTMDRFRLVRTGLKKLDQAVKKNPKNVEIRVLRGYVSYNLPEMFFQRTSTAIEDFEYIVSQYENGDSTITQGLYWQLLYDLGVAYKRFEQYQDSKTTWLKLLQQKADQKFITLLEQEGITKELLAQKESFEPNKDIVKTNAEHYEKEKSNKDKSNKDKSYKEKSNKDKSDKDKSYKEKSDKDKSYKEKSDKDKSYKEKSKKDKYYKEKSKKDKSDKEKSKKHSKKAK